MESIELERSNHASKAANVSIVRSDSDEFASSENGLGHNGASAFSGHHRDIVEQTRVDV